MDMQENVYVVDTSVIIEKEVSKLIKNNKIQGKIIIPRAVLAELEHQANTGQEIGFIGLDELQDLQILVKEGKIELQFIGDRPNLYHIAYAKSGGEIDSLIRDIAYNEGAILITADKVQSYSAKAVGLTVLFIANKEQKEGLQIEKYFDQDTMSVHLKERCIPRGKKGKPGEWKLVEIGKEKLTNQKVQELAKEIVEKSRIEPNAFIEISRPSSTIVQYKDYRIIITKPPVSDGLEITAVKPIKILKIEDYDIPDKINERIKSRARGVIIAGETGSGKSTFAQALAEYYNANNFITKTVESPRDLILSEPITQYSKNLATSEEIHDILFLARPDYIIFDEMRDTPDFRLFTDLRLGGSNVLGVLHAATPIDAIQRFIGRLEVGMIPSVLDTILFIEKGNVTQIFTVQMIVKVPSGMTEADLARPVIEVLDFLNDKLMFEIYSYGEETVVIPVAKTSTYDPAKQIAAKQIENQMRKYVDKVKVIVTAPNRAEVYVPEDSIARLIGKQGSNIEKIENEIGIGITIKPLEESHGDNESIDFKVEENKKAVIFRVSPRYSGSEAEVFIDSHFMFTAVISKKGDLKVHKKSKLGKVLIEDLDAGRKIEIKV